MRMRSLVLAAMILFGTSAGVNAQTIIDNPTHAEFQSTSHLATDGSLTHYRLDYYNQAGTTKLVTGELFPKEQVIPISGAGTPAAWYSMPVPPRPVAATIYTAKIAAVGPSGEGVSALSNPFRFPVPPPIPAAPTGLVMKKVVQ